MIKRVLTLVAVACAFSLTLGIYLTDRVTEKAGAQNPYPPGCFATGDSNTQTCGPHSCGDYSESYYLAIIRRNFPQITVMALQH